MQIVSDFVEEEVKQLNRIVLVAKRLSFIANLALNLFDFILREKFWNVTRWKDIVNVDEILVVNDLRICQHEDSLYARNTSFPEKSLNVCL